MSRKIIRDFIKQSDKLNNEKAAGYFDAVMEVYEDSVHTAAERVATLESDTLWLLIEYRRIVEAKDNTPEEKQQHRMAQGNLWQLLSGLIASTADKGIYLSEAFIKKYENVDFVGFPFGEYVHDVYKVRKWQYPEPQQKHIEAPQQASEGNGGELADSGNGTPPEGNEKPVIKKDDLPTIYNDGNKDREQQVFYNAIQNKLMVLNDDGKGYIWKTNNKLLCLMCAILYWNDEIEKSEVRIDAYNTQFVYTLKKNNIYFEDATRLKEMFGGKDISNYRSKLKELPEDWDRIDKLF